MPGANINAAAAAAASATATPIRRALSDEPPSSRHLLRTPLDRSASRNLLASIRRGTSASGGPGVNNAPTPHAKAARMALKQRRYALFTPGKNRRRSLMEQRETPREILRNLSRALAPHTQPVATSSSPQLSSIAPIAQEDDEDDDELPIDRPRFSLPWDQDDQDSSDLLLPPRLSGLDEENYTVQSIELPRRALSEQPGLRLSRGSFGNARISDFFDQNNDDPTLDPGRHSDFFPGLLEDLQARAAAGDFTLDRIDVDPARRTTMGRESDFGLQLPAGLDDQTTFLLSEPSPGPNLDSPVVDDSLAEAVAAEGAEGLPDVSLAPADAVMADSDDDGLDVSPLARHFAYVLGRAHGHGDAPAISPLGKLDGIRHQVDQHLPQPRRVQLGPFDAVFLEAAVDVEGELNVVRQQF
ncbi:Histone-fold domain containing protein [Ophiocordyceps sinensis CO18]|uniref:Histone-fold domain containing protein n=1 Tax=Ophiocordyceps sinensis (strain Co18 / CGMCC 3.14243) TaxID=911162 RepID=T5AMA5_OPHSC|nr:Histone-fold domain containing protein [Ophiocordyceps sinensis CO18]